MKRSTVQFVLAVAVVLFTFAIATAGFSVSPPGEIHSSVLTLIGEFLGFAAALFGYNSKYHNNDDKPTTNKTNPYRQEPGRDTHNS